MPFSSLVAFFDPFGTVPGSSLNWSQHALLQKGARGRGAAVITSGQTIDADRICQALEGVGQSVADVVDAVDSLVDVLNLRLDEQTKLLNQQVDLLAEIAQTLLSPARTRAAERIRDAAELLRHHRNERALTVAEQAIDDDPNNDIAFALAAWASLGLEDRERARGYFREAAQATAGERNAETRHMNAVFLAARLTFVLDGPEAALRELDAARPFVDQALQKTRLELTREQLYLSVLDPNHVGAFKFDRTIYYVASGQVDAGLAIFDEIAEDHEIRFCLMALTDPILGTSNAFVDAATEAISVHDALKNEIREMLPQVETQWQAFCAEIRQREIRNAKLAATSAKLGELLISDSNKRKSLDRKWPPSKRWLEEFMTGLRSIGGFEAELRPFIEHECMREAALDVAIQNALSDRKNRLVDRGRVEAVVGRHHTLRDKYSFERIVVDEAGKIIITKQEATRGLLAKYAESEV